MKLADVILTERQVGAFVEFFERHARWLDEEVHAAAQQRGASMEQDRIYDAIAVFAQLTAQVQGEVAFLDAHRQAVVAWEQFCAGESLFSVDDCSSEPIELSMYHESWYNAFTSALIDMCFKKLPRLTPDDAQQVASLMWQNKDALVCPDCQAVCAERCIHCRQPLCLVCYQRYEVYAEPVRCWKCQSERDQVWLNSEGSRP